MIVLQAYFQTLKYNVVSCFSLFKLCSGKLISIFSWVKKKLKKYLAKSEEKMLKDGGIIYFEILHCLPQDESETASLCSKCKTLTALKFPSLRIILKSLGWILKTKMQAILHWLGVKKRARHTEAHYITDIWLLKNF